LRPGRLARPALAVLAAAGGLALAGCGSIDAALSTQQATVNFKPGTAAATVAAVRATCSGVPGIRPEAQPAVHRAAGAPSSLRYDVSRASTADLARFQRCLQAHFPAVLGVSVKDTAGQG
jgi:hypothetical protein